MSGKGLFGNLGTQGLEESQDRLGGFQALSSDIYTGTIKAFFAGKSKNGAMSLTIVVALPGGKEYKETLWITNKKGENFFIPKDSTKKAPLPGFTVANDICLVTTEKELHDLDTEEKVIKLWDPEAKKEVPTNVPMVTEVIGKKVSLGILKILENKSEKQGDEYVDTAETREVNAIDKVFHPEAKVTVAEARESKQKGEFWDAWVERNKDKLRDKRTIKDGQGAPVGGGKSGSGGPPQAGSGTAAPKKSLFGK